MKAQIKPQLILFTSILILLALLVVFFSETVYLFDKTVLATIYQFRTPQLTAIFSFLTQIFSAIPLIGLIIIMSLFTLFQTKQWTVTLWFLITHFIGLIIFNSGLKLLMQRPRPAMEFRLVQETTYSFPSGHSASVVLFTMLCTYLLITYFPFHKYRSFISGCALIIILLIGFSRMYLGVHYLTDVIAGYCVGLITAMIAINLLPHITHARSNHNIQDTH
ncbi:phosphatase PAP2 family protein [Aerococcaceae bacterium DSM 111020]|nr:phosphatase PAP2 family protein [Aerococcaceae bacterium DSM 111020]